MVHNVQSKAGWVRPGDVMASYDSSFPWVEHAPLAHWRRGRFNMIQIVICTQPVVTAGKYQLRAQLARNMLGAGQQQHQALETALDIRLLHPILMQAVHKITLNHSSKLSIVFSCSHLGWSHLAETRSSTLRGLACHVTPGTRLQGSWQSKHWFSTLPSVMFWFCISNWQRLS